jgi:hypothetical protein
LGQINLFKPLNRDMVICLAVIGRDIILVGDLIKLINKPLLLKFFALKDNSQL